MSEEMKTRLVELKNRKRNLLSDGVDDIFSAMRKEGPSAVKLKPWDKKLLLIFAEVQAEIKTIRNALAAEDPAMLKELRLERLADLMEEEQRLRIGGVLDELLKEGPHVKQDPDAKKLLRIFAEVQAEIKTIRSTLATTESPAGEEGHE